MNSRGQPRTTAEWYALLAKHDEMREVLDILQPYAKEKYGMPVGIEDLVERALKPWKVQTPEVMEPDKTLPPNC